MPSESKVQERTYFDIFTDYGCPFINFSGKCFLPADKWPMFEACSMCPKHLIKPAPMKPIPDKLFRCKKTRMEGQMNIETLGTGDLDENCPTKGFDWKNERCVRCYELQKRNYAKKSCGSYYNKPKNERLVDTHKRKKRRLVDVDNRRRGLLFSGKRDGNKLYGDGEKDV